MIRLHRRERSQLIALIHSHCGFTGIVEPESGRQFNGCASSAETNSTASTYCSITLRSILLWGTIGRCSHGNEPCEASFGLQETAVCKPRTAIDSTISMLSSRCLRMAPSKFETASSVKRNRLQRCQSHLNLRDPARNCKSGFPDGNQSI